MSAEHLAWAHPRHFDQETATTPGRGVVPVS
jgi:hypothetical protein